MKTNKLIPIFLFISSFIFAQNEYATINIYRPKQFNSFYPLDILINDVYVCGLENGGHLEYRIYNLSQITIAINGDDKVGGKAVAKIFPKKGLTYYFKSKFQGGRMLIEQLNVPVEDNQLKEKNYIKRTDIGFEENTVVYYHEKTEWTKEKLMEHWSKNGVSDIEGIYEKVGKNLEYNLAVLKTKDEYSIIYLSGANGTTWVEGDLKAKLQKTAQFGLFKANWFMLNKSENKDIILTFKQATMSCISETGETKEDLYIKIYPTYDNKISSSENTQNWKSSGTGFFIDKKGYLATNYHVIKEATTIEIVYNGKPFKAKVEVSDQQNDLAILKIDDNSFVPLTALNYNFKTESSEVGVSVFALGFPMTQIMGEEIKFTDGKINAKSGYKGEISTYQISVPIQPGNSGGPLFDNDGNLVGITSSGLDKSITDNVNYAIKTKYLNLLIEEINDKIELPKTVLSKTTLLTEKIKNLSNYVVYIKVK
jgi:S1-C subfamily serine protease